MHPNGAITSEPHIQRPEPISGTILIWVTTQRHIHHGSKGMASGAESIWSHLLHWHSGVLGRQEVRQSYQVSRPVSCDSGRVHLPKVSQPSKQALLVGDQVFKHTSLGDHSHSKCHSCVSESYLLLTERAKPWVAQASLWAILCVLQETNPLFKETNRSSLPPPHSILATLVACLRWHFIFCLPRWQSSGGVFVRLWFVSLNEWPLIITQLSSLMITAVVMVTWKSYHEHLWRCNNSVCQGIVAQHWVC